MNDTSQGQKWFWATLALSSISIMALMFGVWEVIENHFFRDLDYITLHYLYISRGIALSLILAFWAGWYVFRERRKYENEIHRSREYYRGLLETTPNAVVVYDNNLRVRDWNAASERLYGFKKSEVLGKQLPTVPAEKLSEFENFLQQVRAGTPVLEVETKRQPEHGAPIDVQLSLLSFSDSGRIYFFEATSDIRERVRFRQTLLHVEKLTSMGQMAAGTAHHLNNPLASMLLRVSMMQDGLFEGSLNDDLKRLQESMQFCQHFVWRLLDFSHHSQSQKQPEQIGSTIEAVVGLLRPQLLAKRVQIRLELGPLSEEEVWADRNQLESLFLILFTNSLDATRTGGNIRVSGARVLPCHVAIYISDDGCGIDSNALTHIFEPFFTTKAIGEGTGLGLAIARNIVQEHSGSIRVESVPQRGTTACVELPSCSQVKDAEGVPA